VLHLPILFSDFNPSKAILVNYAFHKTLAKITHNILIKLADISHKMSL